MMKSMTGYGKGRINTNNIDCEIEIKSINGRYLDLKFYLPRELGFYEYNIRHRLSQRIKRGTIEVRVNYIDYREPELKLNMAKLEKNYEIARLAQEKLGLREDVSLEYLLAIPDVLEAQNNLDEDKELLDALDTCLEAAIKDLESMLYKEGRGIKEELLASINKMQEAIKAVESEIEPFRKSLFANMHSRIKEIIGEYALENLEQRLMQELALYIDRYDIQEEISRLQSHCNSFLESIKNDKDEKGKSLNFITQEMQREANTLGSKFSTSSTFKYVLILKEEIEKCREIVQNVA